MYMGHDQFGNHYPIDQYPRKELMEALGATHVSKMYMDRKDGTYHVGYIIRGHWVSVFGLEGLTFATKEN